MTELAILNTAYPDNDPWFDLRPFLVNGWTSLGTQTCGVAALPNLLIWNMRLIGDDSTSTIFMRDVPANLRPPQNLPVTAITSQGSTFCHVNRGTGILNVPFSALSAIGGTWDRQGELTITGVTPRGTHVT